MLMRSRRPLRIFLSSVLVTCKAMSTSVTTTSTKIAIAQTRTTGDKMANLFNAAKCAGWAKKAGASMLFLPECFGFIGENEGETMANAEPPVEDDTSKNLPQISEALKEIVETTSKVPSDFEVPLNSKPIYLLDGIKTIARASGLWISGTVHSKGAPPAADGSPRNYNTHIIVDDQGELRAAYNKIHLFDVSIPGKFDLRESKSIGPGHSLVLCDSPIGTYDGWQTTLAFADKPTYQVYMSSSRRQAWVDDVL